MSTNLFKNCRIVDSKNLDEVEKRRAILRPFVSKILEVTIIKYFSVELDGTLKKEPSSENTEELANFFTVDDKPRRKCLRDARVAVDNLLLEVYNTVFLDYIDNCRNSSFQQDTENIKNYTDSLKLLKENRCSIQEVDSISAQKKSTECENAFICSEHDIKLEVLTHELENAVNQRAYEQILSCVSQIKTVFKSVKELQIAIYCLVSQRDKRDAQIASLKKTVEERDLSLRELKMQYIYELLNLRKITVQLREKMFLLRYENKFYKRRDMGILTQSEIDEYNTNMSRFWGEPLTKKEWSRFQRSFSRFKPSKWHGVGTIYLYNDNDISALQDYESVCAKNVNSDQFIMDLLPDINLLEMSNFMCSYSSIDADAEKLVVIKNRDIRDVIDKSIKDALDKYKLKNGLESASSADAKGWQSELSLDTPIMSLNEALGYKTDITSLKGLFKSEDDTVTEESPVRPYQADKKTTSKDVSSEGECCRSSCESSGKFEKVSTQKIESIEEYSDFPKKLINSLKTGLQDFKDKLDSINVSKRLAETHLSSDDKIVESLDINKSQFDLIKSNVVSLLQKLSQLDDKQPLKAISTENVFCDVSTNTENKKNKKMVNCDTRKESKKILISSSSNFNDQSQGVSVNKVQHFYEKKHDHASSNKVLNTLSYGINEEKRDANQFANKFSINCSAGSCNCFANLLFSNLDFSNDVSQNLFIIAQKKAVFAAEIADSSYSEYLWRYIAKKLILQNCRDKLMARYDANSVILENIKSIHSRALHKMRQHLEHLKRQKRQHWQEVICIAKLLAHAKDSLLFKTEFLKTSDEKVIYNNMPELTTYINKTTNEVIECSSFDQYRADNKSRLKRSNIKRLGDSNYDVISTWPQSKSECVTVSDRILDPRSKLNYPLMPTADPRKMLLLLNREDARRFNEWCKIVTNNPYVVMKNCFSRRGPLIKEEIEKIVNCICFGDKETVKTVFDNGKVQKKKINSENVPYTEDILGINMDKDGFSEELDNRKNVGTLLSSVSKLRTKITGNDVRDEKPAVVQHELTSDKDICIEMPFPEDLKTGVPQVDLPVKTMKGENGSGLLERINEPLNTVAVIPHPSRSWSALQRKTSSSLRGSKPLYEKGNLVTIGDSKSCSFEPIPKLHELLEAGPGKLKQGVLKAQRVAFNIQKFNELEFDNAVGSSDARRAELLLMKRIDREVDAARDLKMISGLRREKLSYDPPSGCAQISYIRKVLKRPATANSREDLKKLALKQQLQTNICEAIRNEENLPDSREMYINYYNGCTGTYGNLAERQMVYADQRVYPNSVKKCGQKKTEIDSELSLKHSNCALTTLDEIDAGTYKTKLFGKTEVL